MVLLISQFGKDKQFCWAAKNKQTNKTSSTTKLPTPRQTVVLLFL